VKPRPRASGGGDGSPPFRKVLVANRGEIAVRIARTLRAQGVRSVAVHSDADAGAPHVAFADEAVRIGPADPASSYLSATALVDAAVRTGCDALHPGYGFLSESAALARACEDAGVVFVGPPSAVLAATGDKAGVKERVRAAGVPVVAGPRDPVVDAKDVERAARETGFPLLLKPAAGGGGKGMRVVEREDDLAQAAEGARREARAAFGDPRLYVERHVHPARHVEVQVLCDASGEVLVLGDRDCSVQRRHQKIVEECPAPGLPARTREELHGFASKAAKALGYRNAGTVEFLLAQDGSLSFLEVNRRLQVEHPVTEQVFGVDLVERQLRVAAGLAPNPTAARPAASGHAVEARVCAEDPAREFLPSSGRVVALREPSGPGVRVDSGVREGCEVPPHYDSLLLKVVAWGPTRDEALGRLGVALAETAVLGVETNVSFLRALVGDPAFRRADLRTDFLALEDRARRFAAAGAGPRDAALAGALAEALGLLGSGVGPRGGAVGPPSAWSRLSGWRVVPESRP
jgi:acetyl-CoA/propionyl-CoA carboxylase biotin carboxyl carrier protein